MIRRPPRSTLSSSSAASDVYKRQLVVVPVLCTMAVAYWPVIKASVGSLHRACCARMTSDGALMALQKPLLEESSSRDPDKMLLLTSDRTSEVGRDSDHLETADHA
eukprot:TRINITY_DN16072_c0_g1_i1.p1 TRINITY_DN16072_c0_g1~~TRINITY_DN16072_c0_g1_i1.p1  ORF type:complete len:106 (+),score=18.28 TRINITY_DN16072_c0_g1_i1:87-404(+)